jgi:hypothetical protein
METFLIYGSGKGKQSPFLDSVEAKTAFLKPDKHNRNQKLQ